MFVLRFLNERVTLHFLCEFFMSFNWDRILFSIWLCVFPDEVGRFSSPGLHSEVFRASVMVLRLTSRIKVASLVPTQMELKCLRYRLPKKPGILDPKQEFSHCILLLGK